MFKFFQQIPRTGRFIIIDWNEKTIYKEKARESVPVTRPALQGLRIAHHSPNEQPEAHADMYNNLAHLCIAKGAPRI